MSIESAPWYEPVTPEAGRARSIGWWGALLAVIGLLVFQGALVSAYVYLFWGQPTWPPTGFEQPALWPLLLALVPIAVAGTVSLARVRLRQRSEPVTGLLVVALSGAVVAAALRALPYTTVGMRWDEHAYASLFWVLGGYDVVVLVAGAIVLASLLAQHTRGHVGRDRSAAVEVGAVYWWFAAVASTASLLTLHAMPYL